MSDHIKVQPLSLDQQQFLQQLLASQVVSDSKCKQMYQEICKNGAEDEMGKDMEHCIGIINASLIPGFGMEIRTVVLPDVHSGSKDKCRYHAVVNKQADEVAKEWGAFTKTPHEIAYLKLILQRITESEPDVEEMDEEENIVKKKFKRGMGSLGKMKKMELINLRSDLQDAHKQKITIDGAEQALTAFIREGYLVHVPENANENDDNNDKNQKNSSRTGKMVQLGPRTYMELPEFMEKLLPRGKESLPQFILHGS